MTAFDSLNSSTPVWRRRPVVIGAAVVVGAAVLAWVLWPSSSPDAQNAGDKAAKGQSQKGAGKSGAATKFGGGDPNRPQPVSAIAARSGDQKPAPLALGSTDLPVLDQAPGRYVMEK